MEKLEESNEDQAFKDIVFELSKAIEKILHSGFEAPLHWAMISVNGCVLAGRYEVSGKGLACKFTAQFFPEKMFILPINTMVVDSKGLAARISIDDSKETKVLFH